MPCLPVEWVAFAVALQPRGRAFAIAFSASADGVIGSDPSWQPRHAIGPITLEGLTWNGMHFRPSCMNGAQLGRKVAKNMVRNFFQELP